MAFNFRSAISRFPLVVVLAAFGFSAFKVLSYHKRGEEPGTITIRLGHWQLETGVRKAFDQLAADYQREVNPQARIVQDAIPETTYGQWVTSQMMGETAPDIIEVGNGLPYNIWLAYKNRYFLPLGRLANQPNPYNRGTDLQGVPLRNTLLDGMRTGYVNELEEYYAVPLSSFSSRVFYNRDLLKKLTGSDAAPTDFQQFKRACGQIQSQHYAPGKAYIPIVGSAYHFRMWEANMADPLTYGLLRKADFNRDGTIGTDENYVAFATGLESFASPELVGRYKMVSEISGFCQSGFTGLTRDEGVFLFAQQHSVFISSGTFDAGSLFDQAAGKFQVGVMRFPFPKPDDPEFGPLVAGPVYDNPGNSIPLGVTRFSKHPEIAQDFLLYLASKKGNAKFNGIVGWVPAVRGLPLPERLAGFRPQLQGQYACFSPQIGGDTLVKQTQLNAQFVIKQMTFEDFAQQFSKYYLDHGKNDLMEQQRDWRRGVAMTERALAAFRGEAMVASSQADADTGWFKYRSLLAKRQLWAEAGHNALLKLLDNKPGKTLAPYEYSPAVMQSIRHRLAQSISTTQPSQSANIK